MDRICLALLALCGLFQRSFGEKGFALVFHNHHTVPSNLYVNSAIGGRTTVEENPEDDGKIFNLILYPSDEKSKSDKLATAVMSTGSVKGILKFRQAAPPIGPVHITGLIEDLTPNARYELRIHRLGDMEGGCLDNGQVFDPYTIIAEWRWRLDRSVGEIGFVDADENGMAKIDILDKFVKLVGPRSVIGRMVSIIPVQESLQEVRLTGIEVGCGVIGFAN